MSGDESSGTASTKARPGVGGDAAAAAAAAAGAFRHITMEDEYKVVCALSNSAVFDDLE